MEMIQYTSPVSWDDKGMDWESPDPGNLDYYRAIWEAVIERASLVRQSPNEALHSMMKYRPWSVAAMNAIRESIYTLAPYFVNMEFDDYKEDLSDFPKMWSFRELVNAEGCRICEHPGVGSRISEWGKWLKAIRNTLNKLTVINFTDVSGEDFSRYGAVHDPPFEESISTVLDQTLRGDPNKGKFNSFPQTFCSWSGNTDYKMDPDGTKGYCGYAQSKSILIKTVQRPHPTAECDLIFWSVHRTGGGAAALKLYNNNYNTTRTMVLGRKPFKGMELLPTTSGRHLLKMHIAYKGYTDDSDMFRRLMISASVRDSDGHDRIYWSTLHGRWVDDSASEWINDENLTQKCLEIPLDLVENNPVDVRIYFCWFSSSGFVYIDPALELEPVVSE